MAKKHKGAEQPIADAFRQHQSGQWAEAEAGYRRVLAAQPRHSKVLYLLGSVLAQQGKFEDALEPLTQAALLEPARAEAHNNRGIALKELGRTSEAIASYDSALAARPDYVEALSHKGIALQSLGEYLPALDCFVQATALSPASAESWNNRGIALNALSRREEAADCFLQVIALEPHFAQAHNNLGNVRMEQGRFADALAAYDCALALDDTRAETHSNRGTALKELSRFEEARAAFARALHIQPASPDALSNLATCLLTEGCMQDALEAYNLAIALQPNHVDAHWNRALALLIGGDWTQGWAEYEWRFQKYPAPAVSDAPRWDGTPLQDKTILVWAEQGAGDTLKFARYLPLVQAQGGRVAFVCPPSLRTLLESCSGIDTLLAPGETTPHDYQIPLLSLPGIFGTTPDTVPNAVPYLSAPALLSDTWKAKVRSAAPGAVKIGLCWAGSPDQKNDHNRSCALADFAPLASVPGAAFFSLQKGAAAAQAALPPQGMTLIDLTEDIHDFADTAALVKSLDLVITVDTSVAHLAGALDCPVWTLLPFAAPWHYLAGRTDSPWYPSMQLFQQTAPRDWQSVMARVTETLAQAIAKPLCETLLQDGEAAFGAGDLDTARQFFAQAVALMPGHSRALNDMAVLHYADGQYESAISLMEQVLAQNASDQVALGNMARCRAAQDENARRWPLISIVMPCYKQSHLLPEAVESVAAQTYPHWELIIVNDGSPDDTSEVAQTLINRYPQHAICLIEKENGGLSAARNTGFAAAQGAYLMPLDSDDKLHPQMLEKTLAALDAQPEAAFAFTDVQHFGTQSDIYPTGPFTVASQTKDNRMSYCALLRRSTLETLGGYDPQVVAYEDWDFWLRALGRGMTAAHVAEPLFLYRMSQTSKLVEDNKQRPRFVASLVMRHEALYDANTIARAAARLQLPPPPEAGPLVSVVVPCYGYAQTLAECVESVIAQTFGNWELIIVNDGSPDNTSDVAQELIARYPECRITLIEKENAGVGAARNTGFRAAQGNYFLPLDADDQLHPEFLAKTVALLQAQSDAAICHTDVQMFGTQDTLWLTGPLMVDFSRLENNVPHCCLFRREVFEAVGGYRTGAGYEDWEFWLDALDRGCTAAHLPEPLFRYRQWAHSKFTFDNQKRAQFEAEIVLRHPHLYHASRITEARATLASGTDTLQLPAPVVFGEIDDNTRQRVIVAMNWFFPHVGGEEKLSEDIGAALVEAGFDVEIATRFLPDRTQHTHRGMRIHSLTGSIGDAFRALVDARRPHAVVVIGGPEIDFLPAAAQLPADGPRVVIVPCIKPDSYRDVLAIPALRGAVESAARRADATVCSSLHGYDARLFSDLNIESIYVPNAVSRTEPQGDFRARYGIPKDKPLLLDVSNMRREKNHAGLLHHLRDLPGDWHLALIGGPFEPTPHVFTHVEDIAAMDARVSIVSGASPELIAAAMEDADLLLLPSTADATPLVLIEAMSHRLPWVATPECGSAHDHAGGLMLPLAQFGDAINFLLSDTDARAALAQAGYAHWQACYTYDVIGPRYAALVSGTQDVPPLHAPADALMQTETVRTRFAASHALAPTEDAPYALSVVFATRNSAPFLQKTLDALAAQTLSSRYFEVVVVDDASHDGTERLLSSASFPYALTSYRLDTPRGDAYARNLGLLKAQGEIVLFLSDTLAAKPEFLEQHLRTHQKYSAPHVGVLGHILPSAETAGSVTRHILTHAEGLEINFDLLQDEDGADARAFASNCVSVKRAFLMQRAMFDTEAGAQSFAELGWRIKDDGLHFCYNSGAVAYALRAESFAEYGARQERLGRAAARLAHRNTDPALLFWLGVHNAEDRLSASAADANAAAQVGAQLAALDRAGLAAVSQKSGFEEHLAPALGKLCRTEAERRLLTAYLAERDSLLSAATVPQPTAHAKVSVIIPCYQYAHYLPGAIASLAAQTYGNWEAVIVDDGSPDDTIAVAEQLIAAYPQQRIRLITQENTGHPSFARNRGIAETDGAYVLCMDADDEIDPTFLAECVGLLDKNTHLSIAYTDQWRFTDASTGTYFPCGDWQASQLTQYLPLGVCSLFRRQAWVDAGGWRAVGYEDWDFWLACAERGHRGRRIPKPLYRYRKHDAGKYVKDEGQGFLHKAWLALNHPALHNDAHRRWAWGVVETDRWQREKSQLPMPTASVSVVVTATGRNPHGLAQALHSIRAQTYPHWEIVLTTNGDAPPSDPGEKVTLIQPAAPISETEARERGLQAAQGKYVAYLHENAVFAPNHLETVIGFLEHTRFKIAYADVCGDDGPCAGRHFDYNHILAQNMVPLMGLMHEKSCVDTAGPFDTSLPAHADWEFALRMSRFFDIARLGVTTATQTACPPHATPAQEADAMRRIYARYESLSVGITGLKDAQETLLQRASAPPSVPAPAHVDEITLTARACKQLGLNPYADCPCGSGKKLKFCHYNQAIASGCLAGKNTPASSPQTRALAAV